LRRYCPTLRFTSDRPIPFGRAPSFWLVGAGFVSGVIAAIGGFVDFAGSSAIRQLREVWLHLFLNAMVLVIAAISFYSRFYGAGDVITSTQLILSVCIAALLGFSGWFGGELVFRRRVGVHPPIETVD
jgi:uncharacterized membrane protein